MHETYKFDQSKCPMRNIFDEFLSYVRVLKEGCTSKSIENTFDIFDCVNYFCLTWDAVNKQKGQIFAGLSFLM